MGNSNLQYYGWRRSRKPLPAGYRRVEYIAGAGAQWIDTGVKPTGATSTTIDARYTQRANSFLFGSRKSTTVPPYYVMTLGSNAAYYQTRFGSLNTVQLAASDTQRHVFSLAADAYSIDDYVLEHDEQEFESDYNIYLFACNQNGTAYLPASLTVWSSMIRLGDSIIRDFAPCVRVADSKPGLYDLCRSICPLTNTPFYINGGTVADFTWEEL